MRFSPPELPKTNGRNTPGPSAWADFVRWWWNAPSSDQNECDNRLRQLGYRGRLDGVKSEIKRILPDYKRQCESFIQNDPFFSKASYEWTPRMLQVLAVPNPSAGGLASVCRLNNTVGEDEFSFENGPNTLPFPDGVHLSPVDVLKELVPSGNAGVALMIASLELMGQRRRVSNWKTETPTDREWVFCLAAVICVRWFGGNLPPILRHVAFVTAHGREELKSLFKHYFHVCQACMNPPERNQR